MLTFDGLNYHLCVLNQKLEEQAKELCSKATGGKYLDTNQNPTTVLFEMNKVSAAVCLFETCILLLCFSFLIIYIWNLKGTS